MPVALATDVNPGGGFSPSMPFAMTLACFGMGLTLEEALVAATVNAAWSLDCADRAGSLEPRQAVRRRRRPTAAPWSCCGSACRRSGRCSSAGGWWWESSS